MPGRRAPGRRAQDARAAETGESVLDADRNLRRIWVIKVVKENEVWKLSDFTTQETASCEF